VSEVEQQQDTRQHQPQQLPEKGNSSSEARTNTLAVLALACSIVLAPLGVVFGLIGLKQTSRRGQSGRGFALAGLSIGGSICLVAVTAVITMAVSHRAEGVVASSPPSSSVSHVVIATSAADTTVSVACQEIVPAIKNTAAELQHDTSTNAAVEQINGMMSQINTVAQRTRVAAFEADVAAVGSAMSTAVQQVSATGTSDFSAMQQAIRKVAADCAPYASSPGGTTTSEPDGDGSPASPDTPASPSSVSVLFELADWDTALNHCVGTGQYSDLHPGTPVTLTDKGGVILGVSTLGQAEPGTGGACSWMLPFSGLHAAGAPYALQVGERGLLTLTPSDGAGVDYEFSAALGAE
jgi:hypothetical protein